MSTDDFLIRCFAVSITGFALCLSALTITGIYATWQTFDIPATCEPSTPKTNPTSKTTT